MATTIGQSALSRPDSVAKRAFTGLASTSVEWYDFFLYGTAAALVFPKVFFPQTLPPFLALIASFSTFTVGFIARPIGAVIFGHFGDRAGRKAALVAALLMMGGGTTLIGCLPPYSTVGAVAPLLLVVFRFVQGLAIGGQWGGAMLLLTESAPPGKRGFHGSFAQAGVPVGVVLANLALLVAGATTDADDFMSWGWRIPFLLSVILVALGLFVKFRVGDSEAFESARRSAPAQRSAIIEAFRLHPRNILLAAGAFIASNLVFYIMITFVLAYGSSTPGLGLPRATMLNAVMVSMVAMFVGLLVFGALSDRYGRRRIYMAGALLTGIWVFALFPLMETRSFFWICCALCVGHVFGAMMYGPQAALFTELFETKVRYSGASLGYQIGSIFGGALAPIIATSLLARFESTVGISIYIAAACVLSLVSVALLRETRGTTLLSGPS
jgi:metabolite-proton symporter